LGKIQVLQVVEGRFTDTRSFTCNCLSVGKCH